MAARNVLQATDIQRALTRIAHEILESNRGAAGLVVLGIPTRGVILAQRIADIIAEIEPGVHVPVGALDVTMYRDDLSQTPSRVTTPTRIPGGIEDSTVVLVDDHRLPIERKAEA